MAGSRAKHTPAVLGLVFLGGAAGTGLRAALEATAPAPTDAFPWVTFTINVVGAFLLGLLLEALAMRGPDVETRRLARLGLGTGLLGGLTTYSTFALESVTRLHSSGQAALGLAYAVVTVTAGFAAAVAGIECGRAASRRMGRP